MKSLFNREGAWDARPRWRGGSVSRSCPWCWRGQERSCLPLASVHRPDLVCAASSSQGSLCRSSQKKPRRSRRRRRLLSTKSEAVPAEGVVRLTLHRPEAQKGNSSHKKAPVVGKYLAGLSRAARVEFLCHCPKNLETRTGVECTAKDKPSQSQKTVKEEGRLGYPPNKDSIPPSNPPFLSYY